VRKSSIAIAVPHPLLNDNASRVAFCRGLAKSSAPRTQPAPVRETPGNKYFSLLHDEQAVGSGSQIFCPESSPFTGLNLIRSWLGAMGNETPLNLILCCD